MSLPKNLFIKKTETAKSAMKQIDLNGWGAVFVVDGTERLQGILTPGDIRRSLDVGLDINAPVELFMNKKPLVIAEGSDQKSATSQIFQDLKEREAEIKEPIYSVKIPIINKKRIVTNVATFYQDDSTISLTIGQNGHLKDNGINKVLLVGGAGYLGSVLARLLLENGYRVRVLDTLNFGKKSVEDLLSNPRFELLQGDIREIQTIHKSLTGVDAVVHLAAIVGDPAGQKNPQDTIGINYLASMALALACKYYQINKFIFASTCSVYGVGAKLLDENAELHPVSLYARTKIETEKGILSLTDDNFRPVIMRMSTLYGLSPRMRFDLVVNTFAKMAATEGKITIFGGNQWRPLLHVKDAATAYLKVLNHPLTDIENLIFNVGSNQQNFTIKEIGSFVKEVLPKIKVEIKKDTTNAKADVRTYKVSFDKIEKILNFKTSQTVKNSITEIHQAIKSGDLKNVQDEKYYNFIQ